MRVVRLGDAALETLGFERKELFFEGLKEGVVALGLSGVGDGGRRPDSFGFGGGCCDEAVGACGFAEEDTSGGGEEQGQRGEDPPLVFGPRVTVAALVQGVVETAATGQVGVGDGGSVGVGVWTGIGGSRVGGAAVRAGICGGVPALTWTLTLCSLTLTLTLVGEGAGTGDREGGRVVGRDVLGEVGPWCRVCRVGARARRGRWG